MDLLEDLQQQTPIGGCVYAARDAVGRANVEGAGKYTTQNFLNFMVELNNFFAGYYSIACTSWRQGDPSIVPAYPLSPRSSISGK